MMEMQIPRLRELFEARVGQISSLLSKDPPPELGSIDPTMRGLKGFLFSLEGMLRGDDLRSLPFTARQELFKRVDRAVEAIEALPESLDREQAMGLLRVMDDLHRLCLQENLMAGGMDASKLGKLTVILENKLGEVLESIGSVAKVGDGHAAQISQAVGECLADIQGTYTKESEVLQSSSSLALESIRSQAETIQKRYTEAMEAFDALQEELGDKRGEFQGQLNEQLAAAQGVVDEVRGRQQAAVELLVGSEEQLGLAKAAIKAMEEITRAAEASAGGLRAKLSEGQEVVAAIRGLLDEGTQSAEGLSDKLAEAEQHHGRIEQIQQTCEEFTAEARDKQTRAIAATKETVHAAEQLLQEAQQKLDAQSDAAEKVLSEISAHGAAIASAGEQTHQQQQSAEQSAQSAAESCQQAGEKLAQLEGLLVRGGQAAGGIDELVRAGCDLKARMEQTLAEGGQARDRIAQIEGAASEANAAIRHGKEDAFDAIREAVSEIERKQSLFAQETLEHRQAAQGAVAGLQGDRAVAAELLGDARQDIETLQGEIQQINELRLSASDAEGQTRAILNQTGGLSEELGGVLESAGELKTQVEGHLAGSVEARGRVEQIEQAAAASVEDILRRQEEALATVRSEAADAEVRRKACEASLSEQLESARAVVGDIGAHKATAADLLEQTRQQRDAAREAGKETAQVRVETAEAIGEIQAKLQEVRGAAADLAGLLAAGTESRSKIDTELTAAVRAVGEIGEIRRDVGESIEQVRQHTRQLTECEEQSQQLITELRGSARETLGRLEGQTTDLVARNEQLQQEIEDLFGQAADGGLFRQFDDLAEQSAPRRAKWLRLLIGSGAGGAVAIATTSAILTGFSVWAAGAVLVAGLTPLAFFLYVCATQYNAERRAEVRYQYRASVSRSLTAYRKLLAGMKDEGIADSPFVDRMLSTLFGATVGEGEPPQLAPTAADGEQEAD